MNGLHLTNNGAPTIGTDTGPGGAVTIPDTVNGLPVTSISAAPPPGVTCREMLLGGLLALSTLPAGTSVVTCR